MKNGVGGFSAMLGGGKNQHYILVSTWSVPNFGKCRILTRLRYSNSNNSNRLSWISGNEADILALPWEDRMARAQVVTPNQGAGLALDDTLPSNSDRPRSLNPVPTVISVHLLYPKSASNSRLCIWQQHASRKHTHPTCTSPFRDLSSIKAFLLLHLESRIWSLVSGFIKRSGPGSD